MKNYLGLMKLRVVELLLVTTVPALFIASEGIPSVSVTFWSLLGGTLAAGGANAFNIVIEADSDRLMKRTANRPIATGEISRKNGLIFSSFISILSLLIFYIFTTNLATLLTAIAIIFYVLIFPGNINQYVNEIDAFSLNTDKSRFIRLLFQPILVLLALFSSGGLRFLKNRKRTN